ncbi:MAG: hypothetical protein K1X83_08315 [Oligoflexia bacterium]|nr:hypothetical protein [Oligoflexia bacterium]
MRPNARSMLALIGTSIWLIFTISLVSWWIKFSLTQLQRIEALQVSEASDLARFHRMLMWEGGVLILCLFAGAATLFWYVLRERRLRRQLQLFLLTFAHEIKTPLASLRLQSEALQDDLGSSVHTPLVKRLISDTARVTLQLENAMLLSKLEEPTLFFEKLSLSSLVDAMRVHWPEIEFELKRDCFIHADRRAFEAVLNNLIQNAVTHGHATRISLACEAQGRDQIRLRIADNGSGYAGNLKDLFILKSGSGSSVGGLGLYIVRRLVRKLRGNFRPLKTSTGFEVEICLPGEAA